MNCLADASLHKCDTADEGGTNTGRGTAADNPGTGVTLGVGPIRVSGVSDKVQAESKF